MGLVSLIQETAATSLIPPLRDDRARDGPHQTPNLQTRERSALCFQATPSVLFCYSGPEGLRDPLIVQGVL